MEHREWMYTGRPRQGEMTAEWKKKTGQFLESAFDRKGLDTTWCPYRDCRNKKPQTKETVSKHLIKYGFTPFYHTWDFHGEKKSKRARTEAAGQSTQSHDMGEFDTGFDDCLEDFRNAHAPENVDDTQEDGEQSTKKYYETLFAATKPLHAHTEVNRLDAIARLMAFKCDRNLSRDGFDDLLTIVGSLLPTGHLLTKNMYESTKILSDLKMSYEPIDCCPKGCMLFRKEHVKEDYCVKCKSSRYFEVDAGDGQKRQTRVAQKILRYLPFLPRIQRLFMNEESAQQMRWPVLGKRYHKNKIIHPSDAAAWKNFAKLYPKKAGDPLSVAIAISTDGFNPYGMSAATYSCWPVFVIPMNLPPGVCMRRQNMFLSMIIPGPKYPGKNMSVYLEPLVDDLLVAWTDGVRTYDAVTKTHFTMYVWYHTSLHDLPARALFCGWCTHGKWPCPVCRQALTFFWLKKGGKYSCFDEHRRFLDPDHHFRTDKKGFKKGVVVHAPKPRAMTGTQIKAELDALKPNAEGTGFEGYGKTHNWTHIPCLWKLPYFKDLELPHNIDVMHTEKNIGESLWSTMMDTEQSKDNIKARIDQQTWCDRPHLDMKPPGVRCKGWFKPQGTITPTKPQRREILQWFIDSVFFTDGYVANWQRGVNMDKL